MAGESALSDFRWPVTGERDIAASSQAVWDAISMRGNLELCHPFCSRNQVHAWPGKDSRDEIRYLSGWVFERRFRRWIDGTGYDLEIGRHGGETSFVSWRISATEPDHCSLSITVYPYILQKIPLVIRWVPHLLRVRPLLGSYLDSVVRGFEWYVTRGEPVPRNQFGTHPWFSAVD